MNADSLLLQLKDVCLRGEEFPALENFSLTLESGARLALIGETGCGKEAVLRLIACGPGRGESLGGEIGFCGRASLPLHRAVNRPSLAWLPGSELLSPHASAAGQFARIVARGAGVARDEGREKLREQLARLDGAPTLEALDKKPCRLAPTPLAWGHLAAALASAPQLVLCDAPWSDLGPRTALRLVAALLGEQRRLGFAMLYATRDLRIAQRLESPVMVLRQGKIVAEGALEKLFDPYSQSLLRTVPQKRASPPQKVNRGEPLLQVQGLRIRKEKKREALNFELRRGASLALIGEEGSGRHALMRAVLGMEPPQAGRIVLDAVDVGVLSAAMMARLRRRVTFIDGNDAALDPRLSIRDTMDEPLRANLNMSRELLDGHRDAALGRVGLGSLPARRTVETLCIFDKRRLQIARAIVSMPLLAVIDEPLRGLDTVEGGVISDLLCELRRREGPGFLVITSDFAVAQGLAEDGFVLEEGRVIERGALFELMSAPKQALSAALLRAAWGEAESVSQNPQAGVETAQDPMEESP